MSRSPVGATGAALAAALAPRALACALAAAAIGPSIAAADSFTPIGLQVSIAGVARLHKPLSVTVKISADPGVLDVRTAPLRMRVKLAAECGGEFAGTSGTVLLERRLAPQPDPGEAYDASVRGSGTPSSYGVQSVCVFLQEEGDQRLFASDTGLQVDVSRRCTVAADRYDRAQAALRLAHRARRRTSPAQLRAVAARRRAARRACGPGVGL